MFGASFSGAAAEEYYVKYVLGGIDDSIRDLDRLTEAYRRNEAAAASAGRAGGSGGGAGMGGSTMFGSMSVGGARFGMQMPGGGMGGYGAAVGIAAGGAALTGTSLAMRALARDTREVYREAADADAMLRGILKTRHDLGSYSELRLFAQNTARDMGLANANPIKEAEAGLLGYGLNTRQIEGVMPGLLGQSRLYHKSLPMVEEQFGRAFSSGNLAGLRRAGITLSPDEMSAWKKEQKSNETWATKQQFLYDMVKKSLDSYALHAKDGLSDATLAQNKYNLTLRRTQEIMGEGAAGAQMKMLGMGEKILNNLNNQHSTLLRNIGAIAAYGGAIGSLVAPLGTVIGLGAQVYTAWKLSERGAKGAAGAAVELTSAVVADTIAEGAKIPVANAEAAAYTNVARAATAAAAAQWALGGVAPIVGAVAGALGPGSAAAALPALTAGAAGAAADTAAGIGAAGAAGGGAGLVASLVAKARAWQYLPVLGGRYSLGQVVGNGMRLAGQAGEVAGRVAPLADAVLAGHGAAVDYRGLGYSSGEARLRGWGTGLAVGGLAALAGPPGWAAAALGTTIRKGVNAYYNDPMDKAATQEGLKSSDTLNKSRRELADAYFKERDRLMSLGDQEGSLNALMQANQELKVARREETARAAKATRDAMMADMNAFAMARDKYAPSMYIVGGKGGDHSHIGPGLTNTPGYDELIGRYAGLVDKSRLPTHEATPMVGAVTTRRDGARRVEILLPPDAGHHLSRAARHMALGVHH